MNATADLMLTLPDGTQVVGLEAIHAALTALDQPPVPVETASPMAAPPTMIAPMHPGNGIKPLAAECRVVQTQFKPETSRHAAAVERDDYG